MSLSQRIKEKERRRSNSLQTSSLQKSPPTSMASSPMPSSLDLDRDDRKNRSKRWKSSSIARLFRLSCCGSDLARAEQNRVRNLKSVPGIIQSGHPHQPDLLNLSSVAETKAEADREIVRLEGLCEAHAKENGRLKALLEQRTIGFDAFSFVIKYMVEEFDPFSHPLLIKELNALRSSFDACKGNLDDTVLEKENLQAKIVELTDSHQNKLKQLNEVHVDEINALKESLRQEYESELEKLKEQFKEEQSRLKESHDKEVKEIETLHEENVQNTEQNYKEQILQLQADHEKKLQDNQAAHEATLEILNKDYKLLQNNLEEQLQYHKRQKKEFEEVILKDSDMKFQVAASKIAGLEKEVDSLKAVIELRNNEIHDLRAVNAKVKKLEDELYFSEEKVKLLSTRAEDLQAQIDNKIRRERQLSNEHQLLQQWFDKESQLTKRLSMENDELQWKLQQSMESSALAAMLSGNSPGVPDFSQMGSFCMASSTPVIAGASDGENVECKQQLFKRGFEFGSKKITAMRGLSPMTNRRRRQRFSVSEEDTTIPTRDVSPGSRYRRTQSLSWTVGLKSPDVQKSLLSPIEKPSIIEDVPNEFDLSKNTTARGEKTTEGLKEDKEARPELILSSESSDCDYSSQIQVKNETKTVDDGDKVNIICDSDQTELDIVIKPKLKPLERRKSSSPDARVPSLITARYLDEQSSGSMKLPDKKERRNSLGNIKFDAKTPSPTRKCHRAASWCESKSKSAKNSPVKLSASKKDTSPKKTNAKVNEKSPQKCKSDSKDNSPLKINSIDETTLMALDVHCMKSDVMTSTLDTIELDYAVRCLSDSRVNSANEGDENVSGIRGDGDCVSDMKELSPPMAIHFKSERKPSISSCGSSPPPEPMDLLQISENSQSSRSEDSSPRASPEYRSRLVEEVEDPHPPRGYTMSPRTSAGESMVMDDSVNRRAKVLDSTNILMRRAFPEVYLHDDLPMAVADKDSLSEDANQDYISKPDTPESSTLAMAPTDSTNIDLSWSEDEDEIPSESEV